MATAPGQTVARWPPGTEVIGKTGDYFTLKRGAGLPGNLEFFEGEELTVIGPTGNRWGYEARRKRDGAVSVVSANDVIPELTKRPDQQKLPVLARVVTTASYEAHKPGYLSFKSGEVLEVLDFKIPFWILVRRTLVTGFVHTMYVKGITEEDRRKMSAGETGQSPRVRAMSSHQTAAFGELAFQAGDILEVTATEHTKEDNWRGRNISHHQQAEGYIPIDCVRPLLLEEWDVYGSPTHAVAPTDGQASMKVDAFRSKTDSRRLLQEAMSKGFVLFHVINVLLTGIAGAGKTHAKYLLLGDPPPELRQSTPLAEAPIKAISHTIHGQVETITSWLRMSQKQLMNLLAELIVAGVFMEENGKNSSKGGARTGILQRLSTIASHHHHSKFPRQLSMEELEEESPSFGQLVRFLQHSVGSKRFLEVQWIHFIDSGGQPEFSDVLPQFVHNTTFHIHVLKLNERLDDYPIIECYDENGRPCGKPYKSALRNSQILESSLRSVRSHRPASGAVKGKRIQTIIIGTHRDLEHMCSESCSEKNKELLKILNPSLLEDLVFCNEATRDLIFTVNAKSPQVYDNKASGVIRRIISDKKNAPLPYKVPVSWFLLEQDIMKFAEGLGREVVSKEDCRRIARKLKIKDEALEVALEYFDELNIFVYKPTFLPQVVFSNPQAPLDIFTELVVHSYLFRSASMINPLAGEGTWQRFQEKGIITAEMVGSPMFAKHYVSGLFSPNDIIKLFQGLLIAASVTSTDYLMPALLPVISADEIYKHRSPPFSPASPLLLYFPDGCAPNGLFSALVCYLLGRCRWRLSYAPGSLLTPACLYRNCIEFQLPNVSSKVTLIDSSSYFELHPKVTDQMIHPKVSAWVTKALLNGLDEAAHVLHYTSGSHTIAFFCESDSAHCSHLPHPATIDSTFQFWRCTQSAGKSSGRLTSQQLIWLNQEGTPPQFRKFK